MPHTDPTAPPARRPRYDLDLLVSVSARVFNERGYDGTSMEDLSRATGLAKSAIYHHTAGKEQLLRLALDRAVVPLFAVAEESLARPERAAGRLRHLVTGQVGLLIDALPYVSLLLRVQGSTETGRWALRQRRAFDRIVADLVAEATAEGDLAPGPDPRLVSRLLSGMVNSIAEWYQSTDDEDLTQARRGELADAVLRMAFEGLRPEARP
ncbi:TetR/AcrR family transcriptional regulator [Streptomyces sp. NPDC085927]|uniref:TetR/AcrR family transcriptional regulator n=1 Tax=Streptomyces sp. NPDC085927 TaxID=3365738 RepID=UPI0037D77F09